jgi:hypothetical protein
MRRDFRMLPVMDTIKILLGMTVALLLGALAMSWKGFQQEQRETPTDELAKVQREIDQIRIERERLKLERERLLLGDVAGRAAAVPDPLPAPAAAVAPAPMAVIPEPLGETAPAPPAALPPPPADLPAPAVAAAAAGTGDERARKIAAAPVVAKIAEWVEDPTAGSFATLEVLDPVAAKAGAVLCIRRNSGILGRLKVSKDTPGVADTTMQFGDVKPKPGDELILEP